VTVDEQAERVALGRGLRLWLGRTGLSQKELASKASVNKNTIGNILANKGALPATVGSIAMALGIDVEQLFYYDSANHDKAAQTPQGKWKENLRDIERYVRSLGDDPQYQYEESERLLAEARYGVERFEGKDKNGDKPAGNIKTGGAGRRSGGAGGGENSVTGANTGL